jgi:hypothetical protein
MRTSRAADRQIQPPVLFLADGATARGKTVVSQEAKHYYARGIRLV